MTKVKIPIYKIEVYVTEMSGNNYSLDDIKTEIEQSMEGTAISGNCKFGDCKKKIVTLTDYDEWEESKWNKTNTSIKEYRELFEK